MTKPPVARPDSDVQLLHLVFGGELEGLEGVRFSDLSTLDIVGIFPNYRTAYDAWKGKAQATVDNARIRYFIVHLHRLLDPRNAAFLNSMDNSVTSRSPPTAEAIVAGDGPETRRDAPGRREKPPATSMVIRRRQRFGTRVLRSQFVQRRIAGLATNYLRLVNATSRFTFDPPEPYGKYIHLAPVIFTMWHGQHFMMPFARIFDFDVRVLISRSRDGEMNAIVAEKLGIKTIRGSTARDPSRMIEKGGMAGFLEMKAALEEGACVSMTADISNLAARRAGLGIISLAKVSGRVIVPVAITTSRRIDVTSWDRATINLPFSRAVCAVAEPIAVEAEADAVEMEAKRQALEDALNEATARAIRLADGRA